MRALVVCVGLIACTREPRESTYCSIQEHAVVCQTTAQRHRTDGEVELPARISASIVGVDDAFGCAIANGNVYCWGVGEEGELGDGTKSADWRGPVEVRAVDDAIAIITAFHQVCALERLGRVLCWGPLSGLGVDGAGPTVALDGASAIAGRDFQVCALLTEGVACWGARITDPSGKVTRVDGVTPVPGTYHAIGVRAARQFEMCASFADRPERCWFSTPFPPHYQ